MFAGLENPIHLLVILVAVLLVFGPKRLPELGHSLGRGMRGFKDSLDGKEPEEPSASSPLPADTEPAPEPADPAEPDTPPTG